MPFDPFLRAQVELVRARRESFSFIGDVVLVLVALTLALAWAQRLTITRVNAPPIEHLLAPPRLPEPEIVVPRCESCGCGWGLDEG